MSERRLSDTIAALGEQALLEGFRLAGVELRVAETDRAVRDGWEILTEKAGMVILTRRAASILGTALDDPHSPMTVVLPS